MTSEEMDVELSGLNQLGDPGKWVLHPVMAIENDGSLLRADIVDVTGLGLLLRKRLPRPDQIRGEEHPMLAERQLDNEIRALVRLWGRYSPYPPELPELVGYNFDAPEPFVLMRSVVPASDDNGADPGRHALAPGARMDYRKRLFRALAALHEVDLVHGAVRPGSVRGRVGSFQLSGFEHSAGRGELPRSRPVLVSDRSAPVGPADPADDVQAAWIAYFELVEGRPPTAAEVDALPPLDLRLAPELHGLPVAGSGKRPSAREIVEAMGAEPPNPIDIERALVRGREAFDRLRLPPSPLPAPVAASPPPPPPPPPEPVAVRNLAPYIAGAFVAASIAALLIWMMVVNA
ncbi:hypothetical protein [Amycolatopsis sp. Hca4]|uniref:hypothetical protein n=1 Tax=Amycolatopsis sp. Hca4 TaxID=2742131 RepID=UPI0015917BC4|nr:hypothetical protein [Amycolatopsis sp. Hca4]QKV79934.1 hypothetical protein HUT10_43640 [Amycolatopsis sp. Hca4]